MMMMLSVSYWVADLSQPILYLTAGAIGRDRRAGRGI
jgi:hypothetical protein